MDPQDPECPGNGTEIQAKNNLKDLRSPETQAKHNLKVHIPSLIRKSPPIAPGRDHHPRLWGLGSAAWDSAEKVQEGTLAHKYF